MHFKQFLIETNLQEIQKDGESKRKRRAKRTITSELNDVTYTGKVEYKSNAYTTPDVDFWIQRIRPVNAIPENCSFKKFQELYEKDIRVNCNCPDFGYGGFNFIASLNNYKLGQKEDRSPDIRNPKLEGSVCKHLHSCLTRLPNDMRKIYKMWKEEQEND